MANSTLGRQKTKPLVFSFSSLRRIGTARWTTERGAPVRPSFNPLARSRFSRRGRFRVTACPKLHQSAQRSGCIVLGQALRLLLAFLSFKKTDNSAWQVSSCPTFVSVTPSFNTTDAAGRMHLNVMMTFAQFERELIGKRICPKLGLLGERLRTRHKAFRRRDN
jgi:hypothetical protein